MTQEQYGVQPVLPQYPVTVFEDRATAERALPEMGGVLVKRRPAPKMEFMSADWVEWEPWERVTDVPRETAEKAFNQGLLNLKEGIAQAIGRLKTMTGEADRAFIHGELPLDTWTIMTEASRLHGMAAAYDLALTTAFAAGFHVEDHLNMRERDLAPVPYDDGEDDGEPGPFGQPINWIDAERRPDGSVRVVPEASGAGRTEGDGGVDT